MKSIAESVRRRNILVPAIIRFRTNGRKIEWGCHCAVPSGGVRRNRKVENNMLTYTGHLLLHSFKVTIRSQFVLFQTIPSNNYVAKLSQLFSQWRRKWKKFRKRWLGRRGEETGLKRSESTRCEQLFYPLPGFHLCSRFSYQLWNRLQNRLRQSSTSQISLRHTIVQYRF